MLHWQPRSGPRKAPWRSEAQQGSGDFLGPSARSQHVLLHSGSQSATKRTTSKSSGMSVNQGGKLATSNSLDLAVEGMHTEDLQAPAAGSARWIKLGLSEQALQGVIPQLVLPLLQQQHFGNGALSGRA